MLEYAPADCTVYVLDDATPDGSILTACNSVPRERLQLHYLRSDVNRGFVQTSNWGVREIQSSEEDILLLNSDTEVTAGSIQEMQAVLELHEKHAVVTPRSNNASIYSVPWNGDRLDPAESFDIWKRIRTLSPRYHVMPTAVGFCMLIRREAVNQFGLFDEIYGLGYNEENDFVCRINRYGYSAVAANWAFVFHYGCASFGSKRDQLEATNRKLLDERYPEYERSISDYAHFHVDPVENFAILFAPHRPRILFDLFHLAPRRCDLSDFALNLLREISRLMENDTDLYIGMGDSQAFFANELRGYRIYDDHPNSSMLFDLVFKPSGISFLSEFQRMNRVSPRVTFTLLDVTGARCQYLYPADRRMTIRRTAELADCVFTISDFSRRDFAAFYGSDLPMRVIYPGTNLYATEAESRGGEYVLVIGNGYAHDGVSEAVQHLNGQFSVVTWPNREDLSAREMRDLLLGANVVVYPSHQEDFGLRVIDSLGLGKPVVVLDNAINREIAGVTHDTNLHRISSLECLQATVQSLFDTPPAPPPSPPRRWRAAAEEYAAAFRAILSRDIDVTKLRDRWETLRMLELLNRV